MVDNQSFHSSSDHQENNHMQAGSVEIAASFSGESVAASALPLAVADKYSGWKSGVEQVDRSISASCPSVDEHFAF
ncbi:MAG: hypothetical protein KZQ60_17530 [Candidatus Thiodiazotropha sp. (ex Lucinoma aequizonata)]|nr:hypothetical protein [Candidatus Thiodiazotropha sp. (ex Lucinoma aequizonata)]MCU7888609.1 hypothetical protein [Candidatus Thiodiazotropha sp. (ex Lucinoma aequizonata)]MCU7893976.1 hypothetical protein [Candidatus Thiodiazotropha sp. (ex Lucinoma aequizonata)]MCU7898854.1 hypothetical protein [Candidatus Thiodiazotropha sp. (ex Lucinoma aequizonata)]MCU7910311.1 hypothetical protein [Candidatus Thiodiazotropha sp. (ex Lucinoma aequizonata)]